MIFRSPYPEVEIPSDMSLPAFLIERAMQRVERPAQIDAPSGAVRTFGQVIDESARVAAGLSAAGLRRGDVVALYSPNRFDWPIAYYGILFAGAVVTPVNPMHTGDELRRQLEDTGAVMIVTVPALLERVESVRPTTRRRQVITFGDAPGTMAFDDLRAHPAQPPVVDADPGDVCIMPTSSGTTGPPKPVMLSHHAIIASIIQMQGAGVWDESDTLLNVLPFFHRAGIDSCLHHAFASGTTSVLLPRFDLDETLAAVERYRVTAAVWVPPILQAMSKAPQVESYDVSSLEFIYTAAAPAGRELGERFTRRLGCGLRQVYGMTEGLPVTTTPRDGIVLGSTGMVSPNTEVKIVDVATGAELGPDQTGEIWARGVQLMSGYLNRPDATVETLTPDGWLRTGDIGYADADGNFYVVDRLKELIKYKGYQVAPAELEDILKGHPEIVDAAVIGSLDEDAGELPKAFVVAANGNLSDEDVIAYVAARVAPYKKIRLVEFIDAIPRNPSGKILRRALIERERGAIPA